MSAVRQEYAVTFVGPERAELVPTERDPTPLDAREVEGSTLATLVSAGTELASYRGAEFPRTPGYAAVFEVERTGGEAADLRPGDVAFCMGPHRSFQRAARENVIRVPAGLSATDATFARLMGVTMSTLTTTVARPPATVVVMGLGLVGLLAARTFATCGYDVIGCDPDAGRREIALRAGVSRVEPAVPLDDPTVAGRAALVLECSGHEQAVLDGCRVAARRGEVVLVGTPWTRRTELYMHELTHAIFHRYVVVRSGWEWELPLHAEDFRANSVYGNIEAALRWLAEGRVRVDGLAELVPPSEAQDAYQRQMRNRNERLAVVFDWTTPQSGSSRA